MLTSKCHPRDASFRRMALRDDLELHCALLLPELMPNGKGGRMRQHVT